MSHDQTGRRKFIELASGVLAGVVSGYGAESEQEVPTHWVELPPDTTFWGIVAFMSETVIDVKLATSKDSQSFRGRFSGKRLVEFSWVNRGAAKSRIGIRAVAVGEDRDLPIARVAYLGSTVGTENLLLAFGRRGTPAESSARHGSYPFEAVLVGFVGF